MFIYDGYYSILYSTNDCYKCTICLEEFKEGLSEVVTTKCKHIFHLDCLRNWINNNFSLPKCPNCNELILNLDNKNNTFTLNNQNIH